MPQRSILYLSTIPSVLYFSSHTLSSLPANQNSLVRHLCLSVFNIASQPVPFVILSRISLLVVQIHKLFGSSAPSTWHNVCISATHNLKLILVILIQKCNRHSHNAIVIHRNIRNPIHIDGIVIIVVGVAFLRIRQRIPVIVIVPLPENQFLVAFLDVEVGEPTPKTGDFLCHSRRRIEFRRGHVANPNMIVLQKREKFCM